MCEFGFDDHGPPPIDLPGRFCLDLVPNHVILQDEWLKADPKNVAGIHCKAGKVNRFVTDVRDALERSSAAIFSPQVPASL